MSSSSDELEDDCSFSHWGNWSADTSSVKKIESNDSCVDKKVEMNKSKMKVNVNVSKMKQSSDRFGNWIPPNSWKNKDIKSLSVKQICFKPKENKESQEGEDISSGMSNSSSSLISVQEENCNILNWNNRRNFLDLNDLSAKDCTWNLVNPGIFYKMSLWLNQYGNICASAQGKISKPGIKEGAILVINKPDLLRKLLRITMFEWASLCDSVTEYKLHLNYDAYNNYDLSKLNALEKLWVILCKRRHLIPCVCVTFSINGAMKVMKEFEVFPKLVIGNVYDVKGNEIV